MPETPLEREIAALVQVLVNTPRVAHVGLIEMRAQAEVPSVLRPDTPM